jgi:hypothetical protein
MKLHWLAVVLIVGFLVVGCTPQRPTPTQQKSPTAPTAAAAIDVADKAVADLETALQGTDTEAMGRASQKLSLALDPLTAQLTAKDSEAAAAAHKAGTPAPAALADKLLPARQAADQIHMALTSTPPDVNKAKTQVPQLKSAIDAIRGALK